MTNLKKKNDGFTIIEVMIVLVIAAIILLIVFLAVPALQRNSRNTQRKNDVANLLAGVSEFAGNHNGELPADNAEFISDVLPNVNLGFFQDGETSWNGPGAPSSGEISDEDVNVYVGNGGSCGDNVAGSGTSRQFVALFNVETADGLVQEQCQEG